MIGLGLGLGFGCCLNGQSLLVSFRSLPEDYSWTLYKLMNSESWPYHLNTVEPTAAKIQRDTELGLRGGYVGAWMMRTWVDYDVD